MSVEVVDGGDRACGELLLVLAARSRALAPQSQIRLLATDPAAAIDLPAWCHLTGHDFLGHGTDDDGRTYYDVRVSAGAHSTRDSNPWRLDPEPSLPHPHHREEHP